MENITPYNIYEWIALIASIIVGSSAYMFLLNNIDKFDDDIHPQIELIEMLKSLTK